MQSDLTTEKLFQPRRIEGRKIEYIIRINNLLRSMFSFIPKVKINKLKKVTFIHDFIIYSFNLNFSNLSLEQCNELVKLGEQFIYLSKINSFVIQDTIFYDFCVHSKIIPYKLKNYIVFRCSCSSYKKI